MYIKLSKIREVQIQSYFKCDVEFQYRKNTIELDDIIEEFKMLSKTIEMAKDSNDNKLNYLSSFYGKDRLIVLDDVSGLADRSEKFASFLMVTLKFGYHCVYIFHIIFTEKTIWTSIISQTIIFDIFPACVSFNSVKKMLEVNSNRKSLKHILQKSIWLNRLFIDLANKN